MWGRGLRLVLSSGTDTTKDCCCCCCWMGTLWIMDDDVGDVDDPIPGVSGTAVNGDEDLMAVDDDKATADCEAADDCRLASVLD